MKKKLLKRGYFEILPSPYSKFWGTYERRTEFIVNKFYVKLYEEYYQRLKERNQFNFALIIEY